MLNAIASQSDHKTRLNLRNFQTLALFDPIGNGRRVQIALQGSHSSGSSLPQLNLVPMPTSDKLLPETI